MNNAGILDILIELFRFLVSVSWMIFATLLDLSRNAGPLSAALVVIVIAAVSLGTAALMQGRLNKLLSKDPDHKLNMFLQEAMFTIPGLIVLAILAPIWIGFRAAKGLVDGVQNLLASKQKDREQGAEVDPRDSIARDASHGSRAKGGDTEQQEKPVLVASITPSLLTAAALCAALYLAALLSEPLLQRSLDLSSGLSAWEFLILGDRPELQWYLPLSRFPWMGATLTILFWMWIWWWIARIIRLAYFKELGSNLVKSVENHSVLGTWRSWFGATELYKPADTYMRWARWMPVAGAPWLVLSWLSISADPYRMSPSMLAISIIVLLAWSMHLLIEGIYRPHQEEEKEEKAPELIVANTWENVFHDVKERFHLDVPHIFVPPRVVEPLAMSSIDPASEGLVSPLLTELLPEPNSFTHMQYSVLRSLSLLGYVHTDPPSPRRELELGSQTGDMEEATQRHRNQIILAPEGAGKSTLAMLAACNHAIVHTRSTLIITRDDERANLLFKQMRTSIEPSTLRWNIRERRVGNDLANDLAQGIIPDIVVCSLRQLVINVLDEPQTYTPFLQNIGLIILDDIESFSGPVEVHAQLAIRRLMLRLKELLGVAQLGPESAPMLLAMGTDSMHDTPAWARTLCGVDAVARYFDYSNEEATLREDALKAYRGLSSKTSDEDNEDSDTQNLQGTYQLIYRLNDFRDSDNDTIDVRDLIESCERHGVPWHYRPCGDERRHLGRQRLHLRDEPRYHVHSPLDAGVVFLQGHWAEVQREIERLKRAGALFNPVKNPHVPSDQDKPQKKSQEQQVAVPVAIITLVDRDEEMALTELNKTSSLVDALKTLPRPVVRAPQGRAVLEHLSSEITSNWVEVKDVLDIFGNPISTVLTRLADSGMLMSEERVDLNPDVQSYEHNVYVRATSRAIASDSPSSRQRTQTSSPLLPPRVSQVELSSGDKVSIRDRTNLNLIDTADSSGAHHIYYIGRIFEHAQGRFVVVAHGVHDEESNEDLISNDILVEPYLGDGISSPRRRIWVYHCSEEEALERHHTPYHPAMTARCSRREELPVSEPLLIGDYPIATALASMSCIIDAIATFRLDEKHGDIRQRLLFDPAQRKLSLRTFHTMGMVLYPNPIAMHNEHEEPAPKLRLEEARLIAAAMRAVLPSIYRGATSSIEVAIHMDARNPAPDAELAPHEGFYFYDPQPGGTGAARALHRDGPELLLRLCRVYIERVLYHDRLRARYDDWGDEQEVSSSQPEPLDPQESGVQGTWFVDIDDEPAEKSSASTSEEQDGNLNDPPDLLRERDRLLRKRALIWLDSRLRPEGSLSGGRRSGSYGSGSEDGEGDLWDIGRCWYSDSGEVIDLLWTRHRWRLDDAGGEAMVDVGFDRQTAAASRFLHAGNERLKGYIKPLTEQLQNPAFATSDQTVWGTPRPVWIAEESSGDVPVSSDGSKLAEQPLLDHQLLQCAIAMHDFKALKPLAELLKDRSFTDTSTLSGRLALVDYISRFVQGIPSTAPSQPRGGQKPPVHTLLHREGDMDSKSLLLAILLRHCGFDTGLFINLEPARAMCAVSLFESGDTTAQLQQWRKEASLHGEQIIFGELPERPAEGSGDGANIYMAVDVMRDLPPGVSRIEKPESWLFVPLAAAWFKAGVYEEIAREEASRQADTASAEEAE